jgi:hypothetical protein
MRNLSNAVKPDWTKGTSVPFFFYAPTSDNLARFTFWAH